MYAPTIPRMRMPACPSTVRTPQPQQPGYVPRLFLTGSIIHACCELHISGFFTSLGMKYHLYGSRMTRWAVDIGRVSHRFAGRWRPPCLAICLSTPELDRLTWLSSKLSGRSIYLLEVLLLLFPFPHPVATRGCATAVDVQWPAGDQQVSLGKCASVTATQVI